MRVKYQRAPVSDKWTVACPGDTGDAIGMGLEAGAALDIMDSAWWMPTSLVPGDDLPQMILIERSLPGSIIVSANGERFTNEAGPYISVVNDQCENHSKTGCAIPAHLIIDSRHRSRYPLSPMLPFLTPKSILKTAT